MRIHALTTGSVRVKRAFLFPTFGARRQLDLFLPGRLFRAATDPLLGDRARRRAAVRRHRRDRARQERAVRALCRSRPRGASGGHGRGRPVARRRLRGGPHPPSRRPRRRARARARAGAHQRHRVALPRRARSRASCAASCASRCRPGSRPSRSRSTAAQFGAFPSSLALSDDGRIVAVPTPGHTPGHISVICVDDDGRHVMLAGDVTDSLEQLHAPPRRRDRTKPERPRRHARAILAHCAAHDTSTCPRTTPTPPPGSPGASPSPRRRGERRLRYARADPDRRRQPTAVRQGRRRLRAAARAHDELLVHTGQHHDDSLSRVFFTSSASPAPTASWPSPAARTPRRRPGCSPRSSR